MHASEPRAAYWRAEAEGRGAATCELCPHRCRLAEGRTGLCGVRRNEHGVLELPYYGQISSVAIDPIEKKPLHHFMPGSLVFSVGFVGCNMRCPFCQNWRISQEFPAELAGFTPETLVREARLSGAPSIAFTYSEPTVHFEFVLAAMSLARAAGLKNVLVTNGCLATDPASDLLGLTDAVNVDLKAWSSESYGKVLGGDRDSVLEFMRIAASACHLEVTTLVVPGLSDALPDIAAIAGFIAGLSPDIPLHLSAYRPEWKHEAPPTSALLLDELARAARTRLRHVFVGNVAGAGADSICPDCKAVVIARRGYSVDLRGLKITEQGAHCARCGSALPILA